MKARGRRVAGSRVPDTGASPGSGGEPASSRSPSPARELVRSDDRRGQSAVLRSKKGRQHLANHELVTLAVFLLGGAAHPADTEDIAVKANDLAPGRFVWKRYPNQINLEIIRVYLSDAKKASKGGYLTGSGREGWRLTPRGLEFAERALGCLAGVAAVHLPKRKGEEQWKIQERKRLLSSEVYSRFREGGPAAISTRDAEWFFRVDEYVTGTARSRKIARILDALGGDPKVGPLVRILGGMVRGD